MYINIYINFNISKVKQLHREDTRNIELKFSSSSFRKACNKMIISRIDRVGFMGFR